MILGDFKQTVMRLHNEINQSIFGQGLVWQKVEILHDKVFIIAHNKRVQALSAIDKKDILTTKLIDIALLVEFKERFKRLLTEKMNLNVSAVLKDYDPESEISVCILLFQEDLQAVIEKLNYPAAKT